MTGNTIKVFDFVKIVNRKSLQKAGLNIGDVAVVATLKALPIKAGDPYLQRVYAVICKVTEEGAQIPTEDNEYQSYLVDPRYLEPLSEEESLVYREIVNKQFGQQ